MQDQFFRGIKQWEFKRDDFEGKLPVFYYDTTSMTAIYTASTSSVIKLLPLKQMNPVELFPGRCLVAFTGFEYRKTDIDPYNEFSISFPITFNRPQIPFFTAMWQMIGRCISAYVWQLPVTTEIARVGGVEMYGFPKFIADITYEKKDQTGTFAVSEKGQEILTLKGSLLPTKQDKITRINTYSVIDNIPLKTNVYINPMEFAQTNDRQAAKVALNSDHPICKTMQTLNLSKQPITYQYSPKNQGILFAGRNLMDK